MAKKVKLDDRDFFNEKKLNTIMKRFLNGKANDPEETKYYFVENNVNFYATSLGASVEIAFQNNFEFTYNNGDRENFFVKPSKEMEVFDFIPEYVEVGKGKKKEILPTGNAVPFPDVKGLFKKYDPKKFKRILITSEMIDELIKLHEAISTFNKLGGFYTGAKLFAYKNELVFGIDDIEGLKKFNYQMSFTGDTFENVSNVFHYNPDYIVSVLKTIKDLKVDRTIWYLNDTDPMLFYGKTVDYTYKFAIARKLVKE